MEADHHQYFAEYLSKHGLKYTTQRKIIIDEIFGNHEHFEIENLVAKVRSKDFKVARATVYSTIKLLLSANLIRKIRLSNNEVRYEHIFGHDHHDHIICLDCNHVVEFHDETIEARQEMVCKKLGFVIERHVHTIYARCVEFRKTGTCKHTTE